MKNLMQDPMFFYAVAFFIFIALAFVYGRKPLFGWLDSEISAIRGELERAVQLRSEAEAALADCKAKQVKAESDARAIVMMAQQQVEAMRQRAEQDLASSLLRHEQLASERIRLAEAEAMADVRASAIGLAMAMARKSLAENMSGGDAASLVDKVIAEIPALNKSKAKAA
jgi:F-type H+-transporting ATPase subunit b